MANSSDGWIEVEGLRVHCLMAGQRDAPPVLLLHGGGYDSASLSYGPSIGPISQHHRVFAPDWPGYGGSDKPKMRYTTDYYVDFLGHLMEALGLRRTSLVGISMGGAISLGFSLRWPQRVDKLVLVDSHGLGREVPGRVMSYAMVRLPLLNYVDRLHTLAVPTLILHGGEDRYVPVSWAQRAHNLIRDSELEIFPQCGHWLTREKPAEFDRAVLEFLAS
jgi:pimeloyl-ACP methyl ester carboxylesterase